MLSYEQVEHIAWMIGGWKIEEELLQPECAGVRSQLWLLRGKEHICVGDLQQLRMLPEWKLKRCIHIAIERTSTEAKRRTGE
jgi:hypothetical protein